MFQCVATSSLFFSFITLLLCSSAHAQGEPTPSSTAPKPLNPVSLLDTTIPEQQRAWLEVANSKILAYALTSNSSNTHGGVLLIANIGQHPLVKGSINSLRHQLADNDWDTLALAMKNTDPEQSQQMIAAGIDYLKQQKLSHLVIASEGFSAPHAIQYLASLTKSEAKKIDALVLVNAHNVLPANEPSNEANNEPNTLSQLGELDLLVLDAYSSHSSELQHQAQQRKQATRGDIKSRYYQARLPQSATSNDPAKDIMSRRIRGWLEKYVAKQNKTL